MHRENNGGAWCPKGQISTESYEWLQVDLDGYHLIRGIAVQGRFGNGQGREYAEEFLIEYWRPGINKWVRYTNRSGIYVSFGDSSNFLRSKEYPKSKSTSLTSGFSSTNRTT